MWFSFRIARGVRVSMPWWLALPVGAVVLAVAAAVLILEVLIRVPFMLIATYRAAR